MTHFYEKNIVEIKEEYTEFLIDITTPFIFEGLNWMYHKARRWWEKMMINWQKDPSRTKPPSILKQFQTYIMDLPNLTNDKIERETNRIKTRSQCAEWYDDLVKAVIKSYIVLLTFSTDKRRSDIVQRKYHENIRTGDFIHKCYVECGRAVYNNPELFWHNYKPLDIKRNQREICELIGKGIKKAIRQMLPTSTVLKEFLKNEYIQEKNDDLTSVISPSRTRNIQNMVSKDLHGNFSILEDPEEDIRQYMEQDPVNGYKEVPSLSESDSEHGLPDKLSLSPSGSVAEHDISRIEEDIKKYEHSSASERSTRSSTDREEGKYTPAQIHQTGNIPEAKEDPQIKKVMEQNNPDAIKDAKTRNFIKNSIDMGE